MSNGKYAKRKGVATKMMFMILAVVLIVGISVGGTLAWLTATTTPVTNTFTTSDIEITLAESDNLDLKMVPGYTITKDPKATVVAGSEACYLFVKLEKSDNFDTFMTYEMADGWTALNGVDGVYYRTVLTADMGTEFSVLKDNQVTVKGNVTKAAMNALNENTYPTLKVTAYASQLYKSAGVEFSAADAWANVGNPTGVVTP